MNIMRVIYLLSVFLLTFHHVCGADEAPDGAVPPADTTPSPDITTTLSESQVDNEENSTTEQPQVDTTFRPEGGGEDDQENEATTTERSQKPQTTATTKPQQQDKFNVLKIFHISDLHFDRDYSRFGNVSDFCRPFKNGAPKNRKDIGVAGNYQCDPPALLIRSALMAMQEVEPNPDFIVWTGDSSAHRPKTENRGVPFDIVFKNLREISKNLTELFPESVVVPALGNHDTFPSVFYPLNNASFYSRYVNSSLTGNWAATPSKDRETFLKCGYYSYHHNDTDTHFVVPNTNLYYYNLDVEGLQVEDPCGQLKWLQNQVKDESERIFVVAHVPPAFYIPPEKPIHVKRSFNVPDPHKFNITEWYAAIFAENNEERNKHITHFYGHAHVDAFHLFGNASAGFVGSSVTPGAEVNPSFRLYQYSKSENVLQDYTEYYLNISDIALSDDPIDEDKYVDILKDKWKMLYKATEAYKISDLSVRSMRKVYENISSNCTPAYETYRRYHWVGNENHDSACSMSQVRELTCPIVHFSEEELYACLGIPPPSPSSSAGSVVAVFFVILALVLGVIGFFVYRRVKENRYRAQEFLLTDSVFKYDGYAQVDEDA